MTRRGLAQLVGASPVVPLVAAWLLVGRGGGLVHLSKAPAVYLPDYYRRHILQQRT